MLLPLPQAADADQCQQQGNPGQNAGNHASGGVVAHRESEQREQAHDPCHCNAQEPEQPSDRANHAHDPSSSACADRPPRAARPS
jgi:hypothetical protein